MTKSLDHWLIYVESLHPKNIALGLERVQIVAKTLGVTAFNCPVITVAGTNGKGSCVAFLTEILQQAGYKTGAYTSPHLLRFAERICIAGVEATEQELVAAFAKVEAARQQVQLTYFEFTTLVAFVLFQAAKLDAIVLEVGLGGRLDAVNIIDADVAIVSSIALDHMDWLGDSRAAISREKAGIFRADKPAICGDIDPPPEIFTVAAEVGAQLYCINRDFSYQIFEHTWNWYGQDKEYLGLPLPQLPIQNAATALMALQCLGERLKVTRAALERGLVKAFLLGRFQQLSQPVTTILDVAHNPAAAQLLAQRLQAQAVQGKTLAVVSILSDKDIPGTLQPLLAEVDEWYVAGLTVARGTSAEIMANHLQNLGITAYHSALSVVAAFQQAVTHCRQQDRIVVFGSFYTVGLILEFICPK